MGASSINTNRVALQALQTLNANNRDLAIRQNRMTTGLSVGTSRNNSAVWAIGRQMYSEGQAWNAVAGSLNRALSGLEVTEAALSVINNLMIELKTLATHYADPSLSDSSRRAIRQNMEAHIRQMDLQTRAAEFDGVNFLNGNGVNATVHNQYRYSLPSSNMTPQSFLVPMSSGANTSTSMSMETRTSFSVPRSDLTPDGFARVLSLSNVAGGTRVYSTRQVMPANASSVHDYTPLGSDSAYAQAGRVDVWVDAFNTANGFEVLYDGRRVAASGQPYVQGANSVGAPIATSGLSLLSFDYDPAQSQRFEIRSTGGDAWAVETSTLSPPGSPARAAPTENTIEAVSTPTDLRALNLNPETSGASPSGQGQETFPLNGGSQAGRVDLLIDAIESPDHVEIFQNGRLVAATGVAYAPGGHTITGGIPARGQNLISFDYNPSLGQDLEIVFNRTNPHAQAGWVVGGLELYPSGSPLMPSQFQTRTTQEVVTNTYREAFSSIGSQPDVLTPETEMKSNVAKTYSLDGGNKSGRVDMWVEAFEEEDVVEVWHNGQRIAATGQAYASGGGAVGAGTPQSGSFLLSFDYDHSLNAPLEFRFNETPDATGTAWTVAGLVLSEATSPVPAVPTRPQPYSTSDMVYRDIEFLTNPQGEILYIESRNLSSSSLRLSTLDWNEPDDVLNRVQSAFERGIEAAGHFGTQQSQVERLLLQASYRQDSLEVGIGNLIDADLAKEAAKLKAAQIKHKLATQILSISNNSPQWLLSLFKT